jgi:hypothetical protein
MLSRLILVILLITCVHSSSYSKQWISFHASRISLNSYTGHGFFSLIKDDPTTKQTILVGTWGFYPKKGMGLFGSVDGEIRDDILRDKDISFMIEISQNELDAILARKDDWASKKYGLTSENCISFLRDIVSIIPRIEQPLFVYKFPDEYLAMLKILNGQLDVSENVINNATNDSDQRLIGVIYDPKLGISNLKDWQHYGSTLMNRGNRNESLFSLSHYYQSGKHLIVFSKGLRYIDKLYWIVIDVTSVLYEDFMLSKSLYLAPSDCFFEEKNDIEIFAIMRMEDKQYLNNLVEAYRANKITEKIEKLSDDSDIKCFNLFY